MGKEAREALKKGVDRACNLVKVTLGPKGRNIVIKQNSMFPTSTRDGANVIRNCKVSDPLEVPGSEAIIEMAMKQLMDVGDSTTSVCVLAQAIIEEGFKLVEAGANPNQLKREIDAAVELVVKSIKEQAIPVTGDMLEHVATIAANNDNTIGKLVAEAFSKIGKEGDVTLVESQSAVTRIEVLQGMRFNRGYVTPFCINNPQKMTCELEGVQVLIYDKPIKTVKELFDPTPAPPGQPKKNPGIFDVAKVNEKNALLIICSSFDEEALGTFSANKQKIPDLPVCIVECPEMRDSPERNEVLQDIAVMTGGKVIGDLYGTTLAKLKPEDLGRVAKISVDEKSTSLMGGQGEKGKVEQRVIALEAQLELPETTEMQKQFLKARIARLTGGVAVMYVGGNSQVEMKERKDRCDDAIRATKAALEEGIVPGGGMALINALKDWRKWSIAETAGVHTIMEKALIAPFVQICNNAGIDSNILVAGVMNEQNQYKGYNATTDEMVDMLDAGVIDPAKVVRHAIQNAASIAGVLITTDALMIEELPK